MVEQGMSATFVCLMLLLKFCCGHDDTFYCQRTNQQSTNSHLGGGTVLRTGKKGPKGEPGERGVPGFVGPPGPKGVQGPAGEDCKVTKTRCGDVTYTSCSDVKRQTPTARNGLYTITDSKGSVYRTYCDMAVAGGGWTLVASVHENLIAGKCTTGDRWSSEHGNNAAHPHGDGAWENTRTFGKAESATSDDYKNPGYFNSAARDVMIWHVPNNALVEEYSRRAFMMYHTTSGFMNNYGGNLFKLFRDHYPLRDRTYPSIKGNGPAPPIVWDKGSNAIMIQNTPPNNRPEIEAGYIQFRGINYERGAFAICPGVRLKADIATNAEHVCIGGTSNHGQSVKHCGDFASKDWNGYAKGIHWSSNKQMTESVVMIFYR